MKSVGLFVVVLVALAGDSLAQPALEIRRFAQETPIARAERPAAISATIINQSGGDADVTATLSLPRGVEVVEGAGRRTIHLPAADGETPLKWSLRSAAALRGDITLELAVAGKPAARQTLAMEFLPAVAQTKPAYIPPPQPAPTQMLIGAHHCPLWEPDSARMWLNVLKHPERTPALGFYSQNHPEVADWETKWAVEHGISFFVYCWYRDGQGGAIKTRYSSAIHDGLFKSKFADKMKFTLMWENQSRGRAGVADERDLFDNLLPYWLENYFRHPSYLKVDNKPLLFIYRPEYLIQDLGGVPQVVAAFAKMRQVCRQAGFDGLYLLGEYRGTSAKHLELLKSLGLDYVFAYCWGVPNHPTPQQAIDAQLGYIRKTQELNILPQVVTVSQAWSGWHDEGSIWKIPPTEFEQLLRAAKAFTATLPKEQLGSRMLLLDNWNEWGEGHYLAPYREYGFGYLDAVRNVFSTADRQHVDLLPEDIGRGPYDADVRGYFQRQQELRRLMTRRVRTCDPPAGLIGWWTFDEDDASPVAFDVSGHRLGGELQYTRRAAGYAGRAIECNGGGVVVPADPAFAELHAMTLECRVRTDLAGQNNVWILNRIAGGNPASGFRLGMVSGRPAFQVPVTKWSHQVTASQVLPLGRWVHLAATVDDQGLRLYLDGAECGRLARPGGVHPNDSRLILGNYDIAHPAHFTGLLDDVRLYSRALTAEEIRAHAAAGP